MKTLVVIPARAGSKGLPGKNTRILAGLPLIAHSILCARLLRECDVIVSTDSEAIAAIAREYGAEVPFLRPESLARDDSPTMPVIQHAVETLREEGRTYDAVLLLEPTSPARLPEDIDRAFATLANDPGAHGVVSVSRPLFNPFWVGVVEKDQYIVRAFPEVAAVTRRQDVPTFYRINGAVYLWRASYVAEAPPAWLDDRHRMVEIPERRAISIDDEFEFELAELLIATGTIPLPWLQRMEVRSS